MSDIPTSDAEDTPPGQSAADSAVPAGRPGLRGEPLDHATLTARLQARFPAATATVELGELTLHVTSDDLVDLLRMCREDLACELLADLSGIHWPAGEHVIERQVSTTGWPAYRVSRDEGAIEVLYVLRSVSRNHVFRVSVFTDDREPRLPSVTGVYPTANYHEREVYDFFGVTFDGHPDLTRILMPDDWVGHPHRKDYPLDGVTIPYEHDKFIPPPDVRQLREVVD